MKQRKAQKPGLPGTMRVAHVRLEALLDDDGEVCLRYQDGDDWHLVHLVPGERIDFTITLPNPPA